MTAGRERCRCRYRGRIGSWDVANEVVDDNGYLRRSKWLQGIGDDYIEACLLLCVKRRRRGAERFRSTCHSFPGG